MTPLFSSVVKCTEKQQIFAMSKGCFYALFPKTADDIRLQQPNERMAPAKTI